eukprot:6177961-Pleurochrysis_carterae.AAC.1
MRSMRGHIACLRDALWPSSSLHVACFSAFYSIKKAGARQGRSAAYVYKDFEGKAWTGGLLGRELVASSTPFV